MSVTLSLPRITPRDTLSRNRQIATGVLIAMSAVYLATHIVAQPAGAVLLIRAMAEAGMIGGLADWFAVTALFRHPLGIPIPHTALLPKNQARAARNVGRFFETHFLSPGQIEARVRAIQPSRHIAAWLGQRQNARMAARQVADLVAALLRHEPPPRALARGRALLRRQATRIGSDAAIAGTVAGLAKAGMRGSVAGDVIGLVRNAIDENRDVAVALVQDNSRWWIASTVDRRVADLVVNAVLSMLDDLRKKDGPLRRQLEDAFDGMVDKLAEEGALARAVTEARLHLVTSGALDETAAALMTETRRRLAARLSEDPDALAGPLADLLGDITRRLLADPGNRAALDARIAELAGRIIGEAGPQIAAYVTDVIAGWEPEELNARFEEEIGSDLQFIRINGAALGSLIGGALFAFETLIA
jgi:uncharacterized membrane-anchored protein YjiN (DUF445 family)